MSESESNELDRDVDASMRLFEKSQVGQAAALSPIRPARVMLVLDGSSQDQTAITAAQYLREAFNVETLVLDARESLSVADDTSPHDDITSVVIEAVVGARPIDRVHGDSYEAILVALVTHSVDLLIVPCPFGRDFQKVGTDSAGTVIDVLLSRCPCPMLVIRRDDQLLQKCVGEIAVVVGGECDAERKAAAWAFGLSAERATVTLNLVVEKEQYENIRSIVEALSDDTKLDTQAFADALAKTHQSLHATMAKTASEMGRSYYLRPQAGEVAPPNPLQDQTQKLLVMPIEVDDRFAQGFVQDRIRRSPHPVLVVPSHVPQ
ncbi:universal stress protein [Stieleria sp. TO1_6]|uniref:universal stress protein n=1 Tax=Stieleria tagensis TaxID=2956795 RepID=UPI00209BA78D|nr:universal stress protein [Stieleria tagensis]MCO8121829.1 universal stress protein [Stieleria tagensis]